MDRPTLLREIKRRLSEAFGLRLAGVVLYGSEARGEAAPGSDLDVLALLADGVRPLADPRACTRAVYPLVLESSRLIHVRPVSRASFEAGEYALYRAARAEGVFL